MVKPSGWVVSTVCLLGALVSMSASAEEPLRGSAFGPGEQATYKVHYLGMSAGTAQITVGAESNQWGAAVWPIVTLANTESLFAMYPVKDKFVTYWDNGKSRSVGHELFADEGRKKRRQRVRIDHEKRSAQVMKQKEGESPQESSVEVAAGTADVASSMFALRNMPLAPGRDFEIPVFTGAKSFLMKAHVEGIEKVSTPMGEKDTFKIRVETDFSGKFASKRDLFTYVTTDPAHVPVKIEAEFLLGKVVAELTDYKAGRVIAARPSLAHEG